MRPQRRLSIYVGFDYLSIIRYIEPLTRDLFKTCFENCQFDQSFFSKMGETKVLPKARQSITWENPQLSHFDPHTKQCEQQIQQILRFRLVAHQFPDAFTDNKKLSNPTFL